jgi:hypothetical protein
MSRPARATQAKRARELAQKGRRKEKQQQRAERRDAKSSLQRTSNGEDPDLAGIRHGPQKPLD